MTECELKYLVPKEQFENILSLFSGGVSKTQTNHYYDTSDFFYRKNNTTIRKRDEIVEKKEHLSNDVSIEAVIDLPNNVICYGSLTTCRTSFQISDGMKIEFDKNEYLDITDYEIEIEYDNKLKAMELVNKLGLTAQNNISKSERFFRTLQT